MSIEQLVARRTAGIHLGLDAIRRVHEALGRPGSGLDAIHVVGTNGKGSTAFMLEHALLGQGRSVGLYTSPHLHQLRERVRVDGRSAEREVLDAALGEVRRAEAELGEKSPRSLSFFELLTLAALVIFERAGVGGMVLEAGLGGARDATRVIEAQTLVITRIGMDHQAIIGPTVVDIAREKGGAMVSGARTLSAEQEPEVAAVLQSMADAVGSELRVVSPLPREPAGVHGAHQRVNAALALAAGRCWVHDMRVDALDHTVIPGRLECIGRGSGALWLDVAHNPQSVAAIVDAITSHRVPWPDLVVFGCREDKARAEMEAMLDRLQRPRRWVALPDDVDAGAILGSGLDSALEQAVDEGQTVLICGSHVLVGAIRAHALGLSGPMEPQDPRSGARTARSTSA